MTSPNVEKIDKLIEKLNFQDVIPNYLKQLLLFTGYDNLISICRINEESIQKMEIFAREKLPLLLTPEQKQDFFGIYVTKEQHFEISFGHKELLNVLVEKSRRFLECTDAETTQEKTLECLCGASQHQSISNIKRKYLSKDIDKNTKRNKNNFDNASTINTSRNESSPLTEDNKSKAVNHIKKVILNYVNKFLQNIDYEEAKKSQILSNLNNICVEIKNQTAHIKCTECNFVSKTFTQIENGKYKWVLSNFNKHFKTHFKTHSKNKKSQNMTKNSNILSFVQVNPKPNITEKNINEQSDDYMANNVIIIPYDNVLDTTQDDVRTETEESSNLSLCPLSSVDNLFQKEMNFIENMSECSTSTCTQLHTDDQLTSDDASLFLDLSSDFSKGGIIEETIQNDNNSDKIVQLPHEIKNVSSRLDRTQAKRNLVLDTDQKKITDFFEICERIEQHISECEIISKEFTSNLRFLDEEPSSFTLIETNNPLSFFEMLKNAAVQNSNTKYQYNRFSDELKKLSLYIFLTAGRLAYETLVANMNNSLPSIATLYRTLKEFPKTIEGDLKCSELKTFLQSRNYPMKIFISEDQTAILKRIRYNSTSNQMVGFVCQTSKTSGFPIQNQYQINSVKDIQHAFQNEAIAQNAYTFMAQPLVNGAPAFCLTIFGSNNKFSAEDVLTRWNYLKNELKSYGISVMGFSSDGDPRCLKAMKLKANLPNMSQDTLYAPYFKVRLLKIIFNKLF